MRTDEVRHFSLSFLHNEPKIETLLKYSLYYYLLIQIRNMLNIIVIRNNIPYDIFQNWNNPLVLIKC